MEAANPAAPAAPTGGDWRSQIDGTARGVMVKQIMKALKKHLPMPDQEGLNRLHNIAVGYERKFYNMAPSQTSYSRKIAMLLLYVENPNQNSHHRGISQMYYEAVHVLPSQGNNQAQSSEVPLVSQQQIREQNTSTSAQDSSLPTPGQSLTCFLQTSTHNISGESSIPQMQLMAMHSATYSDIQQNSFSMVQQPMQLLCQQLPQCVEGQHQNPQLSMHQQPSLQQAWLTQQPSIPFQQQQQNLMGQQPNLHQSQLIYPSNGTVEMQQQQRLPVQSNNLVNHLDNVVPHINIENFDNLEFASTDEVNTLDMLEVPYIETDWWENLQPLPASHAEEDGCLHSATLAAWEDPNYVSTGGEEINQKKRKFDGPSSSAPVFGQSTFFAHVDDHSSSQGWPQLYHPG